jgi:hypothetical protein
VREQSQHRRFLSCHVKLCPQLKQYLELSARKGQGVFAGLLIFLCQIRSTIPSNRFESPNHGSQKDPLAALWANWSLEKLKRLSIIDASTLDSKMEDTTDSFKTFPRSILKEKHLLPPVVVESQLQVDSSPKKTVSFQDIKTGDRRTLATVHRVPSYKEYNQ